MNLIAKELGKETGIIMFLHFVLAAAPLDAIKTITNNIYTTVQDITVTVFLIGISIAAMMRMLAFGSERRVAMSNAALTAAIVGLAIFLAASGIHSYLNDVFTK